MVKLIEAHPIYPFGAGASSAPPPEKESIGAKGHHLAVMTGLGLPVPPGFIVITDVCRSYYLDYRLPKELPEQLALSLMDLKNRWETSLAGPTRPFLVSVRSGSVSSMPGMLETILNVGLNDRNVDKIAAFSGNPRFAWDSYRRLIASFGAIVRKIPRSRFDEAFAQEKRRRNAVLNRELDVEGHQELALRYLAIFEEATGKPFPQDPQQQLVEAVEAVFQSWRGARAVEYRKLHGIPDDDGTAVTVQAMVFGNFGHASGTGVAFTRNPSTGERGLYADFLLNAQGEDIVSGGIDPDRGEELMLTFPKLYQQLLEYGRILENYFTDMQDMEFTIQNGKLFLLQTRNGKRTPLAALRIAVDLAEEGIITRATALDRIHEVPFSKIRQPRLELPENINAIARGEVASLGSLSGRIAVNSEQARRLKREGEPVVLVRPETRTEDLPGIIAADGIITASGGRTSHAAVVARHLGKVCLTGCYPLEIDENEDLVRVGSYRFTEGDWISIDGHTGNIYHGRFESRLEEEDPAIEVARRWARELNLRDHPVLAR
ncbi:MAG: pyruvate, phosphate dikinase [Planctomycetes bacterium]|nr:pyruvate, phosphate dikinase [Planctomycetota bacterium]